MRQELLVTTVLVFALVTGQVSAAQYEVLLSQSRAEQERILQAAINGAGYPCPKVTATLFKGSDSRGAGYWAAACSDGGNWMVQVINDRGGSMTVTPCAILDAIKAGDCWKKY